MKNRSSIITLYYKGLEVEIQREVGFLHESIQKCKIYMKLGINEVKCQEKIIIGKFNVIIEEKQNDPEEHIESFELRNANKFSGTEQTVRNEFILLRKTLREWTNCRKTLKNVTVLNQFNTGSNHCLKRARIEIE